MKIIGIHLKQPTVSGVIAASLMSVLGLVVGLVLARTMGGNPGQVMGLVMAAFVTGCITACGASFDESGWRGVIFSTATGVIAYSACVGVFVLHQANR